MHSNVINTVAPTHSSPFWYSELHPWMPSSHHLLSSCTNTRLGPPFLPKFATLTQQPSRSVNTMMPTLLPPSHRQINDASLLHPCMLASQLWCMTPSTRSGFLPLWYMSCWKTATKCAPVMVWSTAAQDNTFMNVVSRTPTLPPMSWQPHHRLLPDLAFLHHCLHLPSLHSCCSLHPLCPQCLQLQNLRQQLSPKSPCACTYVCNTQHSPCAALEIRPCLHHTQAPDPGTATALQPMRGDPDLECLQTLLSSYCARRQRTISPMHVL